MTMLSNLIRVFHSQFSGKKLFNNEQKKNAIKIIREESE
jgi:Na+-transporting NADH:ubiquinone oxidoreductase subunit NqrC